MAEVVQHTWQLLLPTHGNQLLSASELAAHSNGRYNPAYMATTVANTWQPVYSSIKTCILGLSSIRKCEQS